ncbi:hypothetical protein F2Q69_00050558 [Brassica cretica]|uniref:Uncharacterized protein n=1 Tax=Brassica cretica TaxID=69181 RepID=A0A8S9PS36_BRACR|nr:hypothetical protein F2Q69_00050558 [Brassica cretica]
MVEAPETRVFVLAFGATRTDVLSRLWMYGGAFQSHHDTVSEDSSQYSLLRKISPIEFGLQALTRTNSFPATEKDPFAAALLECSKGDDYDEDYDGNSGGSRKVLAKSSISKRFGLVNLYGSCRRSCSVTESIVQLPGPEKSASYDHLLLPRRRR